ncbi:hypothetical protein JNUCC1_01542 [Lentibacillus sp. JNUCC-1]|nr:hypothetical protein [Lentibacillus sp. JNUCC-1]
MLREVAFRGHGLSLLAERPPLWGLRTRAVPAGVDFPPLQSLYVIQWLGRFCPKPSMNDFSLPAIINVYTQFKLSSVLPTKAGRKVNTSHPARGKHGDSCGRKSLGETPEVDRPRRLSSAHWTRSVFPERLPEPVI